MSETQVIFRVDKDLLYKFDEYIKNVGFKTRNEWFRNEIRRLIETDEEFLERMGKIAREKGITNEQIMKACRRVRKEIYKEEYGDD